MAKRGDFEVSRLLVLFLRFYADISQAELAKASRVSQANISLYENGEREPKEPSLRRIAKAVGVEWTLVMHLRRFIEAFLSAAGRREPASIAEPLDLAVVAPALLGVIPVLIEDRAEPPPRPSEEEERQEAEEVWKALEAFPVPRRRRLIELAPRASRSAALATCICEASAQAADRSDPEALELAELAFSIAERVEGEESGRVQGYCWAHVVNARRAAERLS